MAKPRKKPEPKLKEPEYPRSIETYQDPRWSVERVQLEPSCFNGIVRIDRYRITIEKIEEPFEVLRDRLIKLWRDTEYNSHYWDPMRKCADQIGMSREELKLSEQGMNHPSHPSWRRSVDDDE